MNSTNVFISTGNEYGNLILNLASVREAMQRKSRPMNVGIFTDKKHHPTETEIQVTIGTKWDLWQEAIQYLREVYSAEEDFKFFYGKNYGWALSFRLKSKLVISLYPRKEGFSAQVNLSPKAVEKAQAMALGHHAQQAIAQANPYSEGRWLFVVVENEADLRDVEQLLVLRSLTKRF
jgi:hypothetical protein